MTKTLRPDTYARNTLERYTGSSISDFRSHVILVNFPRYIEDYASLTGTLVKKGYWTVVHDRERDISIINYGVGSPSAGIVMHCLSFVGGIRSVLMLGMCGGIDKDLVIGDFIIPTASVRDEGTSIHYLPKDVPAQPSFWINQVCESVIIDEFGRKPRTGIMLTTDYRMWEFDGQFIDYILKHRIMAIDMEIATIFAVAYAMNVPAGALMLVSDLPLRKGGIKSKASASRVFLEHTANHLRAGLKSIERIRAQNGSAAGRNSGTRKK